MAPSSVFWPQNIQWCRDANILRHEFNSCQVYERLQNNELKSSIFKSRHRSPTSEPECTLSQVLLYWNSDNNPVAMVHQYLRPDGTIGGSGKPDPKRIVVGDKLIALRAKSNRTKRQNK